MKISKESISRLEAAVERHEKEKGVINLAELVTTNCSCTGSHCSTGCSGNKGGVW